MISIFKSPHLQTLAGKLAELLEKKQGEDPLAPQSVIVPNKDTARWLKLFLADQYGFIANVRFMLPVEWQWHQVRKLYPDLPGVLPSDPMPMSWSIFRLLRDQKARIAFPKLHSYMKRQQEDSVERAAWQLARQISSVFDQYLVYRPELIQKWQQENFLKNSGSLSRRDTEDSKVDRGGVQRNGSAGVEHVRDVDEAWQADLWNFIDNEWKKLPDNDLPKSKSIYFKEIMKVVSEGGIDSRKPMFVFNPGLVPLPVLRLMKARSNHSDLYIFMILPTADRGWSRDNNGNELLRGLGVEALDIQETVSELLDSKPVVEWLPAAETVGELTNLNQIRNSVILNRPIPGLAERDGSIQIRSCHSELREVETLYQFLLECFEEDPDLAPDDVLVVMPDPSRYRPFIEAVFGVEESGLPKIQYHFAGNSASKEMGLQRAFERFLMLPDSRFSFEEVMDFVQQASVRKKFDFSVSDLAMLKNWFRKNHVKWGIDASHRSEFGQPGEDLQTWQAAMRRGWLGQLFGDEPGEVCNGVLLFRGIESQDQQQVWASFSRLLGQLERIARKIREPRTCAEWKELLTVWMRRFFAADDLESRVSLRIYNSFEKIEKEAETAGVPERVSWSLMRTLLLDALDESHAGTVLFTRGVVFSSMVPVRSIPFKVIALLGLNEDVFPRKPAHPEFDLMARYPKKGERNRKNEDRNLFLESILTAQNIHYSSYIGRSQKDDEPISPSPVLAEWLKVLDKALEKSPQKGLVKQEALYGFSPDYFGKEPLGYSRLYKEVTQAVRLGKDRGLRIDPALSEPDEPGIVDIGELEYFYRNPVRAFFARRLGVSLYGVEDEDDDEFAIDSLDAHLLFQRIFGWFVQGMNQDQMKKVLLQAGALPAGWPGEKKLRAVLENAGRAVAGIEARGRSVERIEYCIDIFLGDKYLSGSIYSFSGENFLDVSPSVYSGSVLFTSWIRHLCLTVQKETFAGSDLMCELKEKKVKWVSFSKLKPDNARKLLEDLIDGYRAGLMKPLMFFPKSAFEYVSHADDDKERAIQKAQKEWWNDFHEFAEGKDPYVRLYLGDQPELNLDEWGEIFYRFMKPMTEHLES